MDIAMNFIILCLTFLLSIIMLSLGSLGVHSEVTHCFAITPNSSTWVIACCVDNNLDGCEYYFVPTPTGCSELVGEGQGMVSTLAGAKINTSMKHLVCAQLASVKAVKLDVFGHQAYPAQYYTITTHQCLEGTHPVPLEVLLSLIISGPA